MILEALPAQPWEILGMDSAEPFDQDNSDSCWTTGLPDNMASSNPNTRD